jgi:hypothetical protein
VTAAEIVPEPGPEEREALLLALAAVTGAAEGGPSAWWQAGVREAVEEEPEPGGTWLDGRSVGHAAERRT